MGVHPSLLWPLDFLFGPMRGQGSPPPRPAQAALHPRPQPEPKLPALVYSEDRPALRSVLPPGGDINHLSLAVTDTPELLLPLLA
uniref:Uncharacterized protein n=1 Tax=Rangifer tarandus platyrhynchus TaxID=3082113 RepID=A0ACB0E4A6_RANTA|nr:unnamed protein product [Rangifer tarandus platyrhynchus]